MQKFLLIILFIFLSGWWTSPTLLRNLFIYHTVYGVYQRRTGIDTYYSKKEIILRQFLFLGLNIITIFAFIIVKDVSIFCPGILVGIFIAFTSQLVYSYLLNDNYKRLKFVAICHGFLVALYVTAYVMNSL